MYPGELLKKSDAGCRAVEEEEEGGGGGGEFPEIGVTQKRVGTT